METFTTLQPVPFESFENCVSNNNQTQDNLVQYFLGESKTLSVPGTSSIQTTIQLLSTLVSHPKDVFVSKLLEHTHENTDELELMRMELLKLCKQLPDFPYPSCSLKRRLEKRSNGCDSLSIKLAKDCHTLMIASSGNYSNDLSDVLSAKSARICTSSESDNIRIPIQNVVLYESISRIDREVITLRCEYVQDRP